MQEQTKKITEAVIDQKLAEKIANIKKEKALDYLAKLQKHQHTLNTLHFYGTTLEEVNIHKSDEYFSTWFQDANNGDIHAMHSILDHFEPLEIITNMGHNYRSRFSENSAEIILDFRPDQVTPQFHYELDGADLLKRPLTLEERKENIKPYLYSCILRIAKELMLYFPLNKISFLVNCPTIKMDKKVLSVTSEQVQYFLENKYGDTFIKTFESTVLN
ncbi:hypothetical protein [Portibacter lacus]|uniref:Uncharacterized protein n=1 Tax=Portibacter lacus TaxID=1099794 RepID=A0AA37SQK8_9BACT|nr:hypothetical protein [Portibacter lacus]GLR18272.1 hypothetical protein GCM10007940_28880 [Portibacter lacus]